ncbi:hypothetical protein ACFQX6_48720 [Streptosporangium lutulentum]
MSRATPRWPSLVDALNAAALEGLGLRALAVRRQAAAAVPAGRHPYRLHLQAADVALVGPSTVLTGSSGPGQPFSIARQPLSQGFKKAAPPTRTRSSSWPTT